MGRQNVEFVKIPINDGIFAAGSELEIGERLARSSGHVFENETFTPFAGPPGSVFDPDKTEPNIPDGERVIPDALALGIVRQRGTAIGDFLIGFGVQRSDLRLQAWVVEHGFETKTTGTVLPIVGGGTSAYSWCAQDWPNLGVPAMYMSHPDMTAMQQMSTTNKANWIPTGFSGVARAMLLHLDRLWLAKDNLVHFSDVFDPNNFRAGNFVQTPDLVTSLFRAYTSVVDAAAGSHLIISGLGFLVVVDGDPTTGNALKRTLSDQIGVATQNSVVTTSFGAFAITTNQKLVLIPPGAPEVLEVGREIRNKIQGSGVGPLLLWREPFLFVWTNNVAGNELYIAKVSRNGLTWTGPHVNETRNWIAGGGYFVYPVVSKGLISQGTPTGAFDKAVSHFPSEASSVTVSDDRSRLVETGAIARFGHDILCDRIHLEYKQSAAVANLITFTFTFPDGTSESFTFTGKTGTASKYEKEVLVPPVRIRGRWFKCKVACNSGPTHVDQFGRIKDITLEIHTVPRVHE